MNIHLPAILGFTRYQGFDPSPYLIESDLMAWFEIWIQWTLFFLQVWNIMPYVEWLPYWPYTMVIMNMLWLRSKVLIKHNNLTFPEQMSNEPRKNGKNGRCSGLIWFDSWRLKLVKVQDVNPTLTLCEAKQGYSQHPFSRNQKKFAMCTLLQSNMATTKIMINTSVLLDDFQWKLFSHLACWITRKQYQRASLLFSRGVVGSFAPLFAKTNVGCFLGISLAASCLPPPNHTHTCKTRVYIYIYIHTYIYICIYTRITWVFNGFKKNGAYSEDEAPNHTTSYHIQKGLHCAAGPIIGPKGKQIIFGTCCWNRDWFDSSCLELGALR